MTELIYIEHLAGEFKNGLQICRLCGQVISDYTGEWASTRDSGPAIFSEGPIWTTGTNPVQWTTLRPLENYGGDDPYKRIIKKCTDKVENSHPK